MKVAIIGAGAIGGYVGARLALTGKQVTFLARGANLQALREHGLQLIDADGSVQRIRDNIAACDDYAQAGPHDLVIVAVKAHQLGAVAAQLPRLLGAETPVVTMQNGIPFWYFHRHGGPLEGLQVRSVDSGEPLAGLIAPERVIGCVVYPAAELVAPGVVRHVEGNRFPLGELDGQITPRVQAVAACFESAGLKAPVLTDIRAEIWLKLWGNLSFNPISALAHATLADICGFEPARELAAGMMREAQDVAQRLGVRMRVTLEQRIVGAAKVGAHKTSMLQDIEAGREPEIAALLGSVLELAHHVQVDTPRLATVYALVRLLAQGLGRSGGGLRLAAPA